MTAANKLLMVRKWKQIAYIVGCGCLEEAAKNYLHHGYLWRRKFAKANSHCAKQTSKMFFGLMGK